MATLAIATGFAFTAIVIVWIIPRTVITISQLKVHGDSFRPGDLLEYEFSYCKSNAIVGEVHLSWIDGEVHLSWIDGVVYGSPGTTTRDLPTGCHVALEEVEVPNLLYGNYRLEMVRIYHVTPLQQFEARAVSQPVHIAGRAN
jgi:hypothetical protein